MTSPDRLSHLTLALLLAVAGSVVLGGAMLACRTETARVARDRAPLRDFALPVEEQLRRLERLYENHLRQIADGVDVHNAAASRSQCDWIVGVRQLSVLHRENDREADQHVIVIKAPSRDESPEPTLRGRQDGLPRPTFRLAEPELFANASERAGWIDRPGQPLIYWQRRDGENVAIVMSIGREDVAAAIDGWLRAWLTTGATGAFAGVAATGGPDRLMGAQGSMLGGVGHEPAQPETPDFLLPLRGRFGTWQLTSWDRLETKKSYHLPTLVAASALGLFTAFLGAAVFMQQRRATALAAQRVSFVNRVSHELRTPLTNILLNLDLATEALGETSSESSRRLGLIREEGRRLGRLIDNVLTFSRGEQGKLRTDSRACVPGSVIAAVVEQFAPSFERRALEIRCSGQLNTPCLLDADAFAQILANLFSNLEKYVPGGIVDVAGTLEDNMLTLTITDKGPGIPVEAAERIFRPFERLGSRVNEGVTGTGLGLAIARDLAASMGGSLRLVPSVGGASFQLRVPTPRANLPELVEDRRDRAMPA